MRGLTAPEITVLDAAFRWHSVRVEVKDAAGSWVDRSTYVIGASWGADVDQPIAEARVQFRRDDGVNSLSPLRGDSPLNTGGAAIDAGREIRISPATSAHGVAPVSGDYKLLFLGTIDSVDFANSTIEIVARDQGGALVDAWVEAESAYGAEAGRPLEDVMQDILTAWAPGVTLYTPVSPGFNVVEYNQQKASVFETLRTLAGLPGWDVRYLWDSGTAAFRLTLFEPDRAKTSPDWTFAGDRYFDVTQLAISRENVRNYIVVSFTNVATGAVESVSATDAASVARFGRRWMEIEEGSDSPIDTPGEAQALADAALADLAWPIAEQEIELPFFWPIDLGDLLRFTANSVHASDDLDLAVTGYQHELAPGRERTRIAVRGKPAGFYRNWLVRGGETLSPGERAVTLRLHDFREIERDATAGTVTFGWKRGSNVATVIIWENYQPQPLTADPWPNAGDVPTLGMIRGPLADYTVEETVTVPLPVANEALYLQVEPRGTNITTLGEVQRSTVYGPQGLRHITIGGFATLQKSYPHADVFGMLLDPEAVALGTLYAWVDNATPASADTTAPATHFKAGVNLAAPYSFGPATTFTPTGGGAAVTPLLNITFQPAKTKSVAFRFIADDGRDTGIVVYTLEDFLDLVNTVGELRADAINNALQFASSIRPPGVGASLPADGSVYTMWLKTSDSPPALYRWDPVAVAWTKAIATVDLIGTVVTAQIAANAITAGQLAANSVTGPAIAPLSVTTAKIAAFAITAAEIATGAITAGKIAALSITAGELAANSVTASAIAANAVTAGAIAANQIVAGHINAGAVTATAIATDAVTAIKIQADAVTAGKIQAGAVTTNKLATLTGGGLTINMAATGTQPVLDHAAFQVLANGTATFSGALSAASGTFSGALSGATGTFSGSLTATNVLFTGTTIQMNHGSGGILYADSGWEITTPLNIQLKSTAGGSVTIFGGSVSIAGSGSLGFFGATPIGEPTITGSRNMNAALADLLTKLASLGLITDGTTA